MARGKLQANAERLFEQVYQLIIQRYASSLDLLFRFDHQVL